MRKFTLLLVWFTLAYGTFAGIAGLLGVLRHRTVIAMQPPSETTLASANSYHTGGVRGISTVIEPADARKEIVAKFLDRYDSPLLPHAHFAGYIVDTADKYGVDYRLIPAIMMQESNLCKKIIQNSHNCLGFGIHERGTLTFDTYEQSIDRATRELKLNYIDQGLTSPEQIMSKYTPGSNGSWAASVNQWIAEMEFNDRSRGIHDKSNADLTEYTKP